MQAPSASPTQPAKQNGKWVSLLWLATAIGWAVWVLVIGTEANPRGNWISNFLGDKVVHAGSFAVGGVLWIHSVRKVGRVRVITAAAVGGIIAFVFGLVMEIIQRNIPEREADPGDIIANLVGIFLAVGLYILATSLGSRK